MVKKLKWNLVLMSALYLGLGVFLLMKPTTALNIVCYALGAVVLACAAVQLIRYFVVERGVFQSQLTLISGIICLALGAFLILRSDMLKNWHLEIFAVRDWLFTAETWFTGWKSKCLKRQTW